MATFNQPLSGSVQDALRRGQALEAIRLLREETGLDLKSARDAIDAHRRRPSPSAVRHGSPTTSPPVSADGFTPSAAAGDVIAAIRRLRDQTGMGLKEAKDAIEARSSASGGHGLSPGEVPRGGGGALLFVAVLLALAWLGWRYLATGAG
ncbi:MAG: hypothetical protein ABI641_12175 [Caldimonas sp.]